MNIEKRGVNILLSWEQLAPPDPGYTITTPKSRWWLARRKVFVWLWSRFEKLGLRRNFIQYATCYECGGAVEVTEHIEDCKWVAA